MKRFERDKSAVSAVIATVIIVAITIALAIAVAYWMSGLATIFTRYEKIEVKSSWVTLSGSNYIVSLNFTNTGAVDTTIDSVFINGKPISEWGATAGGSLVSGSNVPIGKALQGTITFARGAASGDSELSPGVTVTITIHTSGGKDYLATVVLP